MTWEPLLGGGVLALAGVVFALVERARRIDFQWAKATAESKARLLAEELDETRKAMAVDADTRETVVAAQRVRIGTLERQLEKHEAQDPVLAGEHLSRVLLGDGKQAGPAAAGGDSPGVRPATDPGVGAGPRRPGRR